METLNKSSLHRFHNKRKMLLRTILFCHHTGEADVEEFCNGNSNEPFFWTEKSTRDFCWFSLLFVAFLFDMPWKLGLQARNESHLSFNYEISRTHFERMFFADTNIRSLQVILCSK